MDALPLVEIKSSATIDFDLLNESKKNFVCRFARYPTIIIMHPADAEKFMQLMWEKYQYCAIQNLLDFQGTRIIRSFDITEGQIEMY